MLSCYISNYYITSNLAVKNLLRHKREQSLSFHGRQPMKINSMYGEFGLLIK
jgi:hypothetical protein